MGKGALSLKNGTLGLKVWQHARYFPPGSGFFKFLRKMNLGCGRINRLFSKPSRCLLFDGVCLADPLPPARFEVNPEKTTSTTLQVRWTPSSGKVTWYEVQLLDNSQKLQEVQVQESNPWSQYTFLNLTAGSNYRMAITAVSGEKRSFPVYTNGSTGKICVVCGK